MPQDSTPRSLLFLISKSPGSTAPIMATATLRPVRMLGAPQTIWSGAGLPSASVLRAPTSTVHTFMWSESGCGTASSTWPVTTFLREAPVSSTPSTSVPVRTNSATKSCGSSGRSTISLSHSYETRILLPFLYAIRFLHAARVSTVWDGSPWSYFRP